MDLHLCPEVVEVARTAVSYSTGTRAAGEENFRVSQRIESHSGAELFRYCSVFVLAVNLNERQVGVHGTVGEP